VTRMTQLDLHKALITGPKTLNPKPLTQNLNPNETKNLNPKPKPKT